MKAIIYARVSSVGERQSTERQVLDLKEYAKRNNIIVEKIYEEHISGAKKNNERPVLMDCLEFTKTNNIDILLVSELSRLGRNTFEVLTTVKDLIDSNINVYFQKEQITLLDNNGKPSLFTPILIATLGTCAEMERENIQYRLNSGRRILIATYLLRRRSLPLYTTAIPPSPIFSINSYLPANNLLLMDISFRNFQTDNGDVVMPTVLVRPAYKFGADI